MSPALPRTAACLLLSSSSASFFPVTKFEYHMAMIAYKRTNVLTSLRFAYCLVAPCGAGLEQLIPREAPPAAWRRPTPSQFQQHPVPVEERQLGPTERGGVGSRALRRARVGRALHAGAHAAAALVRGCAPAPTHSLLVDCQTELSGCSVNGSTGCRRRIECRPQRSRRSRCPQSPWGLGSTCAAACTGREARGRPRPRTDRRWPRRRRPAQSRPGSPESRCTLPETSAPSCLDGKPGLRR